MCTCTVDRVRSLIPLICASNRFVNKQLAIAGLRSFIGVHLCNNLLQHNDLALSLKKLKVLFIDFHLELERPPSELRISPRVLSPAYFLTLRLLFLAVLELGAPLSSFLEEALYNIFSMNERMILIFYLRFVRAVRIRLSVVRVRAVNVYPGTRLTEGWYLNGS